MFGMLANWASTRRRRAYPSPATWYLGNRSSRGFSTRIPPIRAESIVQSAPTATRAVKSRPVRSAQILRNGGIPNPNTVTTPAPSLLPFALNGRPEDREEAELRLARSIREDSAHKDAPMARWVDRRVSWRISYWLAAHTRVTPNMVTVANTIFGLSCAWMFSIPNYWVRLFAAIFFLISITLDGVDGELARLKMVESDFGGTLDVVTDNIVHAAVFVGLLVGCYRVEHSHAYLYLIPILLGGFTMCAIRHLARLQNKRRAGGTVAGQGGSMERARFRLLARGIGLNQSARVLRLGYGFRNLRVCLGLDLDYRTHRVVNGD